MSNTFSSITYSWFSHELDALTERVSQSFNTPAHSLQLDGGEMPVQAISVSLTARAQHFLSASWEGVNPAQLSLERPDTLRVNRKFAMPDIETVLSWLSDLPFEVCIGGSIFSSWPAPELENVLFPGQYPLGWMLAVKGKGHRYWPSARWFEQAPVKIHRKDDVTLIQFHDLQADAATALEQAKRGWSLFNRSATSGFLGGYKYEKKHFDGQYNHDESALSVTVFGRDLGDDELKEACYCKNFMEMNDGRSIKKVIFVFFDPVTARKWLPQLWIRGLECRAFIDGKAVTLSDNYAPEVKNKLDW